MTRSGDELKDEGSSGEAERLDLSDFTPYLLNVAAESQSSAFAAVYKARYGMTRTEWRVLYHLDRHGPMIATAIGQRAHPQDEDQPGRSRLGGKALRRAQGAADGSTQRDAAPARARRPVLP